MAMNGSSINPYALYVYCDGAMDYDHRNTAGVGLEIRFPDFVDLESIKLSIGRYEGANIERVELEAIIQGMNEAIQVFEVYGEELEEVNMIIFITDRYGLNDNEKTSPFKIREWRRNKWHNYEGKAIKNSDLLDKIDKTRKKVFEKTHRPLRIEYGRRKFNKMADKLAKRGKKQAKAKKDIALTGLKLGKRKYDGTDVDCDLLLDKSEHIVHVFKKESVREQWAISTEFCEGAFKGRKLNIYTDDSIERKLHRHHNYMIRIKRVFTHHVTIYKTVRERKRII